MLGGPHGALRIENNVLILVIAPSNSFLRLRSLLKTSDANTNGFPQPTGESMQNRNHRRNNRDKKENDGVSHSSK